MEHLNKQIYIMIGLPGSGKSTEAKRIEAQLDDAIIVSRDAIRFSLLDDNDKYFANEKTVFNLFIKAIQDGMNNHSSVIIDATHVNEVSRNKVLSKLDLTNTDIIAVNMLSDINTCLKRNDLREGRTKVPAVAIRRMAKTYAPADNGEKFTYKEIINIT